MTPRPLPWPVLVCFGVIGGAIGTVGLAILIAKIEWDRRVIHR